MLSRCRTTFTDRARPDPRGDTLGQFGTPLTEERTRRIARRAVSYEKRPKGAPATAKPDEVGLLFMCVQSSIGEQFEFQQADWSNNEKFLRTGVGSDPVIGQGNKDIASHTFPAEYGRYGTKSRPNPYIKVDTQRLVTMKGGEYFFMPSLSFLKSLKTP